MVDCKKTIFELIRGYNGFNENAIPYGGAKVLLVQLLFTIALGSYKCRDEKDQKVIDKYADLFVFDGERDDMNAYDDFMFGFDQGIFCDALNVVEKDYHLPKNFLVDTFWGSKLFNNIYDRHAGKLIDVPYTSGMLPMSFEECAEVVKTLLNIPQVNKDEQNTQQFITNENLQILVSRILKSSDTETFADCGSGFFCSSLYNDAKKYCGFEKNRIVAGVGALIAILTGKEVKVHDQDCVANPVENVADKLFWDTALQNDAKTKDKKDVKQNDIVNMVFAVNALKDGGVAAVTCTGGFCVKQDSLSARVLLLKDHLKAVISLPPMWQDTKANTFVVVLQKNCKPKDIVFINASGIDVGEDGRSNIKTRDLEMIEESLEGKEFPGFSAKVSVESILENPRVSLMPSHYVKRCRGAKYRPTTVIECDLMEAYGQLREIIG